MNEESLPNQAGAQGDTGWTGTGWTDTGSGQRGTYLPPPPPLPPVDFPLAERLSPPPLVDAPDKPARRSRRWPLLAGKAAAVLAAMAATAAVTYAVAHRPAPTTPTPSGSAQTSQYSAADQAAAKQHVCQVFDASTRQQKGEGGMIKDGQLNVPVVLRTLNAVVAVQNALTPATPQDVSAAAHKYIDTNSALATAALANVSADEGNRLREPAVDAVNAFLDACGLPRAS